MAARPRGAPERRYTGRMKLAQRLALATALLTLALIALGAYVRASHSGLGCPDWPTCHGGVIPPNNRRSIIEYLHRFVASSLGLFVIATAVVAWKRYRHVGFIVWTSVIAVPLVGFQGVLGAITVYRELPPEIVATHLLTAMVVLSFELAVYVAMYFEDPDHHEQIGTLSGASHLPGKLAVAATAWLAAVTWIGGYMVESGASTACEGWPLCNGSVLPANQHQEITHMIHRYLAGLLVVFISAFVVVAWKHRRAIFWAGPVAIATAVLYVAQVLVGAFNVWYAFPGWLTVSHTAIASGVWFTLSIAFLFTYYSRAPARVSQTLSNAGANA
jgi:cytochrome c oxidase assembly protein subunit 15